MVRKTSLSLLFITGLLASLSVHPVISASDFNSTILGLTFDPPDEDQPRTSSSGGSRGKHCLADSVEAAPYLIAVVPQEFAGLTTQAHPSILVYVGSTTASKAFFSIKDEKQDTQYYTPLDLPEKAGIIRIELPDETPELKIGQTYSWHFALMCDDQLRPDSPTVEGYIQRTALSSILTEDSPLVNQVALYSEAGIWYETAEILATLRHAEPDNAAIAQAWDNLLTTAGLEAISTKPIIP